MKTEVAVLAAVATLGGLALSAPAPRPHAERVEAISSAVAYGEKGRWGAAVGHTDKAIVRRREKNKESRRQRRANKKRRK